MQPRRLLLAALLLLPAAACQVNADRSDQELIRSNRDLTAAVRQLEDEVAELLVEVQGLRFELARVEERTTVRELEVRRGALQQELAALGLRYTQLHPDVQATQAQLEAVENALRAASEAER